MGPSIQHPLSEMAVLVGRQRLRKGGGHCKGTEHHGKNPERLSLRKLLPAPPCGLWREGFSGAEARGAPQPAPPPPQGDGLSKESRGPSLPDPLSLPEQPWLPSGPAPSGAGFPAGEQSICLVSRNSVGKMLGQPGWSMPCAPWTPQSEESS